MCIYMAKLKWLKSKILKSGIEKGEGGTSPFSKRSGCLIRHSKAVLKNNHSVSYVQDYTLLTEYNLSKPVMSIIISP